MREWAGVSCPRGRPELGGPFFDSRSRHLPSNCVRPYEAASDSLRPNGTWTYEIEWFLLGDNSTDSQSGTYVRQDGVYVLEGAIAVGTQDTPIPSTASVSSGTLT